MSPKRRLSTPFDPGYLDGSCNPLQGDLTGLGHLELSLRGRNGFEAGQDFSSLCERGDPGSLVHLSTAVVLPAAGRLGGMDPDTYQRGESVFSAVLRKSSLDRDSAFER